MKWKQIDNGIDADTFNHYFKPQFMIYETGATSHAVNDLILFTDNTKELAEMRDRIYAQIHELNIKAHYLPFNNLFKAAKALYRAEFGFKYSRHMNMSQLEIKEYCELYANDFENWKQENL